MNHKTTPLATSALATYDARHATNPSELSLARAEGGGFDSGLNKHSEESRSKAVYMNLAGTEVYYNHEAASNRDQGRASPTSIQQ